jgi:hypothetical protein
VMVAEQKRVCGPSGCGRNEFAPLQRLTLCGCNVGDAAIGAIGVMSVHNSLVCCGGRECVGRPGGNGDMAQLRHKTWH